MKVLLLGKGNIPARYSLVSINCENWVERNFCGHEIITFGYNEGVDIQIDIDTDFSEVVKNLPDGWVPDFCLLWEVDWNLIPRGIEDAPFPTITIAWDWDFDIPFAKAMFELTDFTVALGEFEKEAIHAIGASHVEVNYFIGVIRDYFASSPKKMKDRKYDILYTTWIDDVVLSDRSEWIMKLSSLADTYNICVDVPRLSYTDYNELLADSKTVLSHHRYGSMSGRIIEAGAQGTIVLETGDEVKRHFVPDKEYIPITKDNFADQIETYLSDEQALQDMSDRAHSKATGKFEASDRFSGLLSFIEEQLKGRDLVRTFKDLSKHDKCMKRGEIYYYAFYRTPTYIMDNRSRMLELSIAEFQKAVDIEPTARAITDLAIASAAYEFEYRKNSVMEEKGRSLVDLFHNVLLKHPEYVAAYFYLGTIHMKVRNFKDALDTFRKALALLNDKSSEIDPWCLYFHDLDEFRLRKAINRNLLSLCKGNDMTDQFRDSYKAAIEYSISIAEKETGHPYRALEMLQTSCTSHPGSGLIVKEAARLQAMLGPEEESLKMYEHAVTLLPFDIDLKVDYIKMLYLCNLDDKALAEINGIYKMMKTVHPIRNKQVYLQYTLESFGRVKSNAYFSHDSCKERTICKWIEQLFSFLNRAPGSPALVNRIIELLLELGRVDKAMEIMQDFMKQDSYAKNADRENVLNIDQLIHTLQRQCGKRREIMTEKLQNIEAVLNGHASLQGVKAE